MAMDALQILTALAAGITATGIVAGVFAWFYKFARRVEKAIGEDKNGQSISDRLARVEHQVFPNGGGSLSDQVKRVDKQVGELKAETSIVLTLLTTLVDNHGPQRS